MAKSVSGTMSNLLGMPFSDGLSPTGYELPEALSEDAWLEVGKSLGRVRGSTMWWIGDWWNHGEQRYGERKALVESEEWEGPKFQTCANAAAVCSAFTSSRRREVSFSIHNEVVPLPVEWQDKLLDWAQTEKRSVREVREEVKRARAFLSQGWTSDQLERKARAEAGECVTANIRVGDNGQRVDEALLSWAESQNCFTLVDRKTEWGNPFEMPGDGTRDEVCDLFESHYFPFKKSLHKKTSKLRGHVLGCWCHPERCHAHSIAKIVNEGE